MPNEQESTIGVFAFDRTTKNTVVFTRTLESGRRESQYVQKSVFGNNGASFPDKVEVLIRW